MRERSSAGQCQTVWAQTGSSQKEKGFTGKKTQNRKKTNLILQKAKIKLNNNNKF